MSNRDTILPLSRIVSIPKDDQMTVALANTAHYVTQVAITSASGFDVGKTRLTASSVDGTTTDEQVSAIFDVVTILSGGVPTTLSEAEIVTAGVYRSPALNLVGDDGIAFGLKVSGDDATYPHGLALLGVSANMIFNVNSAKAFPTYVTVTDVSGNGGWFKVQPGSSADLYTSAGPIPSGISTSYASGVPGVMAPAQSTVTLTMQPSQKLEDIEILNKTNTVSEFLVNYGIIKHANSIRDQEQPEVT